MGSIPNWVTTLDLGKENAEVPGSIPRAAGTCLTSLSEGWEMFCTQGSNVVTHRSATCAGAGLTSLSSREAVLTPRHPDFLPSGSRFVRSICMALLRPRKDRWRYFGALLSPTPCFHPLPSHANIKWRCTKSDDKRCTSTVTPLLAQPLDNTVSCRYVSDHLHLGRLSAGR